MSTAEAGWYDDGTGRQRWWDGTRWTAHFVDFADPDLELRTSPDLGPSWDVEGWFDDGRGRLRFWDGRKWTPQTRFGPEAREYAGFVVDQRWIHFGELSVPIKHVVALLATAGEIRKRPALREAVLNRALFAPDGRLSPGRFGKADHRVLFLAVEAPQQLWLSPVRAGDEPEARRFLSWANTSAEHYRFRD